MRRFLGFFVVAALLLGGCGGSEEKKDSGGASAGGGAGKLDTTIRINLGGEPATLDPSLIEDIPSNKVMHSLMEALVWLDDKMVPQPGVATSWEHSEDYRTWTFKLRPEARWHNGDPVVAGDFKFAAERIMTPSTTANYAAMVYTLIDGGRAFYDGGGLDKGLSLDSIKAIDDHTLQYRTAYPAPFFLTMVAYASFLPLNKRVVEQHGDRWSLTPETYVGNGPFKMVMYKSRDRLEAVKADTYWDRENIFWEKVVFLMIDNENTEDSAFRTGQVDVTESVAVPQMDYWMQRPEFLSVPGLWSYYVGFNNSIPPFDNKLVRKAFSKAIDREVIVRRIAKEGTIAGGIVPHGMPSAVDGKTYREMAPDFVGKRDVEEAKRLLSEAGYPGGKGLPAVEYLFNTTDLHKVIGEQMQNQWRQAFNVDVRLQNAEWSVTLGRLKSGDYQFARMNWIADYADPLNFLEIFQTGNAKNNPRFSNARFDELIEKARHEGDPVKRQEFFVEAERILVEEECAIAPLYTPHLTVLVRPDIEGLGMNPMGVITYVRARRVAK